MDLKTIWKKRAYLLRAWRTGLLGFCLALFSFAATAQTTLSVNPAAVAAGGTVTVSWSGITAASGSNWIGLYAPGASSQAHGGSWIYVNCTKTVGSAFASGSCPFAIPTGLAGSYELRLHAAGSWTSIAKTSLTITSSGAGTTLSVAPASASTGSTVTVSWSAISSPTGTNWIGLYVPGTISQNHNGNWMYVNCSKTSGAAFVNGSCPFSIPTGIASGSYELRLHASATWTVIARAALTITAGGGSGGGSATVSVSPASVAAGGSVTASWSGIAAPAATDWIGLYLPGASSQDHSGNWMYVSCSKSAGSAFASGSCPFPIPSGLAAGGYELRLHANGSFNPIATSSVLTVTGTSSGGTTGGATIRLDAAFPSFGSVGAESAPFFVKATGTLNKNVRVTPNDGGAGGVFSPASLLLSPSAGQGSFRYKPASGGLKTISIANDAQMASSAPMFYSAGATSSNVVQFLTHDNSSGPSNIFWNYVLRFRWKRGVWGDWLDAQQKPFGESIAGATPYASFPVPRPARYSADVTALVKRWQTNGENRGFYLRMRGNDFSVQFTGRTGASVADRPKLQVTTTTGTYSLDARCNASWAVTSNYPIIKSDAWSLSSKAPAILQFELNQVSGTVTKAVLSFSDVSHQAGSTSANGVIDIFEADPPRFVVPDQVTSPATGVAARYSSFASLASDPAVVFSDDFASPGWADAGWVFPVERIFNSQTGTTYARGQFVAGSNHSASVSQAAHRGTGPFGSLTTPLPELFGQYHFYLERDFGSTIDIVKFPGVSLQYGYWSPLGYWQSITGNGGSRGTGLKVWNATANRWEYHGHSVRILIGQAPVDDSAYSNLRSLWLYPYNLDQTDFYPEAEPFPYVAVQRERWYAVDVQAKQNSIVGPFDATGNGTAVADGVYRVWINGWLGFQRTDYRWRRHPDFGVQGIWIDFYHGGKNTAPHAMHYRVDRASLANQFIGPLGGVVAQ